MASHCARLQPLPMPSRGVQEVRSCLECVYVASLPVLVSLRSCIVCLTVFVSSTCPSVRLSAMFVYWYRAMARIIPSDLTKECHVMSTDCPSLPGQCSPGMFESQCGREHAFVDACTHILSVPLANLRICRLYVKMAVNLISLSTYKCKLAFAVHKTCNPLM